MNYFNSALGTSLLVCSVCSHAFDFSGVIVDQKQRPIPDATVFIYATNKSVTTNNNGEFSVSDLKPGHYHVHISAVKYQQRDIELIIEDQDVKNDYALLPSVLENIIVTATALNKSTLESASPVSVMSGEELVLRQAPTLGETLKHEPGINASYFGPVASSPIIRGMEGPRVRITQNGLNSGDVSRVGADHAIATETATATQIEILRGPATLLYGSGAVGGVVNVVDNRIPFERQESLTAKLDARFDSVSNGETLSADINGGVDSLAWHIDGFYRDSSNYDLPHGESLDNSDIRAHGGTIGASYVLDDGYIGFSYGRIDNKYGIPGHAEHGHDDDHDELEEHEEIGGHDEDDHDEERVYADMSQDRYQMISSFNVQELGIQKVDLKMAYNHYQHKEVEDGATGTQFKNDSAEARFELFHDPLAEWQGVVGLHWEYSDFDIKGDEAFTPPSKSNSIALFVVEERDFDKLSLSLGARVESNSIDPNRQFFDLLGNNIALKEIDYTPVSASIGAVYALSDSYSLAMSYAFSQRAPSSPELFSLGEHVATQRFEIGGQYRLVETEPEHYNVELASSKMKQEVSNNIDLTLRQFGHGWGASFTLFYNQIDDFIYQQDSGLIFEDGEIHPIDDGHDHDEHGLPVLLYSQSDAKLYGYELELNFPMDDEWRLEVFSDYIRGKLDRGGDLPRIPPLRVGASINWDTTRWHANFGATWHDSQTKTAEYETSTGGYTLVEGAVSYFTRWGNNDVNLFLRATNLTDKEARVHSSFIKDMAPLPGRNITAGIQIEF